MNKFIQYVGTPQQTIKIIKRLVSSDTKLINLTEDKELESIFDLYSFFDPLKNNIEFQIDTIKDNKVKRYIIYECHFLNSSSIKLLIDLYKENNVDIFLFSNYKPLELKIPFIRGVSINEPLLCYDYSLSLLNFKIKDHVFNNIL